MKSNNQSPLSYIKNPLVSIIVHDEDDNGMLSFHFGQRSDIPQGFGSEYIFQGIKNGYKNRTNGSLEAMALIITVSESIKREFPDIAAKVRELNLALLKAKG